MTGDGVTRIHPLLGALSTLEAMRDQAIGRSLPWRDDVLREEWDGIIVDTCQGFDTHEWETGVSRDGGDKWIVVEQYDSRVAAAAGHAKWVADMQDDPGRELRDIDLWGLESARNP